MNDPLGIDLRPRPWHQRLGKAVLFSAAGVAIAIGLIGVVPSWRRAATIGLSRVILAVATPLAPDIDDFGELAETSDVLASDGSLLVRLDTGERRDPVVLADLPDHVKNAVLAAEDRDFYNHSGVDPDGVLRATLRIAQKRTEGGSTITQQLAKNNYAGNERTFARKLREVLYASKLERRYSKDELLERYLNQIYFGEGAYGLTSAAQTFFAKAPSELTVGEAAVLAGKIRAPERLDPRTAPDAVVTRRNQVLRAMVNNKWLTAQEAATAEAEPLVVAPEVPPSTGRAPHFVEYVKREAAGIAALGPDADARSLRLFTGGLKVETTLDPKFFDAAAAAVQAQLGAPGDPAVAAVTVKPGDGAILSLFGGLTFERKFDVASQGRRQPGSSYKPFVYLAMLQAGIDPRSMFPADSPQTFEYNGETFDVGNYEDEGSGESNVEDAMVHSLNTVFMRIGLMVGPDRVVATARAAHDPADPAAIDTVPSVALGGLSQGVTPLEHAAAYAAFAAKGRYAAPYAITRITDRNGVVIYEHEPDVTEIYRDLEVGVLTNALQRVVREGTGRGAFFGRPVAGKTGTTQNYGDAWFVGYVPQAATAVWVGDPTKITPMLNVHGRRVTGGSFPASIFAATMRAGLEGVPVAPLFTASPDQLSLQVATTTTTSTSTTTTSLLPSTTSAVPSTVAPPATSAPASTAPPSTAPPASTTSAPATTTTSTTAPATTTTTGGRKP